MKLNKDDFIGKQGIIDRGTPIKTRVGLKITGRELRERIVRYIVMIRKSEEQLGYTCSVFGISYSNGSIRY